MTIRITEIKLRPDEAIDKESELFHLKDKVSRKFRIVESDMFSFNITRKAIDARKKEDIFLVYSVDMELKNGKSLLAKGFPNVKAYEKPDINYPGKPKINPKYRPVIVGFGPAGIFAALTLAKQGLSPLVLEQGPDVDKRTEAVSSFGKTGVFSPEGTVLFGEGGAGTFSDGKLTTLINDPLCDIVLDTFIEHGADPEIKYQAKPHIGTDVLKGIIKSIRKEIMDLGGEVRFNAKVTDFIIKGNKLEGIVVNDDENIEADMCILAIGHSARDTYELLLDKGLKMEQKPFSVGVRIEHLQNAIDEAQYGKFAGHKALGPADYKLAYHAPSGRTAYTFCMCPGGFVVNSSSEEGGIATNGMSYSKRSGVNANSALLVNVGPGDYGSDHPLAGIEFQRGFERKANNLAGNKYYAPIQSLGNFLDDRITNEIGFVKPTYLPDTVFAQMADIYPDYVIKTLKEALPVFDKKIKGFASNDAILTAPETRSSSPVRTTRSSEYETNIEGIYSIGEGSGYSGGIMSSAIDGIRCQSK
ncbi:MAG TPA: NAD(P)/FAD-dependent oxidoreductase [Bacillota bacterium]|nr:NAD(P)/FAD-dependent oxidoreductase [Bacillota bacterium]HPF42637.1 NAD(P)/FAD-dependent oxidoreductase [Bacillota bacterium]HPJ86198.1 NAD(P)/FAD-dependent oxidoreductase [Bacillota bacterium]HPQ62268.1 NAD(P)/FAD-dependent oxidoreductase [Bacillota bacterium]HRX91889.1 NAD(P)/FAD-dependent oxidoreductase [Candidatus Izemoplasmatales bacterium]